MSQVTDAGKLADEFKNLFSKTVQGNIDLANRLSRLASDAAREFSASAQQKRMPSASESLSRLAELNLSYWSALADHSLGFANDLAGAAERAFGLERPQEKSVVNPAMAIEVSAQAGGAAVAGFQVENTFSDPLEVSFEAGDLISSQGRAVKSKSVVFKPCPLTLAPKTQAVIQTVIEVPEECKPGESYTMAIKPVGFPMKQFLVRLNIAAPAAGSRSPGQERKAKSKKGEK